MSLGGEINEEISLVPQSQILGRHDPYKYISGYDSSLMMEKVGGILNDEIRGKNSVTPHAQKLNPRMRGKRFPSCSYRRFGRDVLPRHVRSDGSNAKKQSMKSTLPPCYKFFNYFNSSLFGLVEAKYQGKFGDPFKANPAPSWSSLAAIVMHFLISLILMQFYSRLNAFLPFLSRVAIASGVVSSLSLISLLLPKLSGQLLICTSWALFVVILWWPTLESVYGWLLTKIKALFVIISGWPTFQSAYRFLTKIRAVTDDVISSARNWFTADINSQEQCPPV